MKIKNVSMTEFKNFILSQPDDRMIDLLYSSSEDVGCPLVHYTRNKLKRKVTCVGICSAKTDRATFWFDDNVQMFMHKLFMHKLLTQGAQNYKKVKTLIQKFSY